MACEHRRIQSRARTVGSRRPEFHLGGRGHVCLPADRGAGRRTIAGSRIRNRESAWRWVGC
jgi:hypothetical protein